MPGEDNFTANEDTPLVISVVQLLANDIDPDGGTVTFVGVQDGTAINGVVSVNPERTAITFTPSPNYNGNGAQFKYLVSDGVLTSVGVVQIVVQPVNDAPQFETKAEPAAKAGVAYLYDIKISDPDVNDSWTYEGNSLPAWLSLAGFGGTAKLYGTPGAEAGGTNVDIVLVVRDQAGASSEQRFTIIVAAADPPTEQQSNVTSAASNANAWVGQPFVQELNTVDANGVARRAEFGAGALPWLSLQDAGNGLWQLTGTPGQDAVGEHIVEVQLVDAAGNRESRQLSVVVAPAQ